MLEITGQDPDGELLARPARWDGEDEPPTIYVILGREAEAARRSRRGERILARLSETKNGYEARIIKKLGASAHRVLGVYRVSAHEGRIAPIDRKTRTEFMVDSRDAGGAANNELVLAEPLAGRASGLPRAKIVERLGSMNAPKAISLIAIHAHGIPTEFPESGARRSRTRESRRPARPHGFAQIPARHDRSRRCARSRRCGVGRT